MESVTTIEKKEGDDYVVNVNLCPSKDPFSFYSASFSLTTGFDRVSGVYSEMSPFHSRACKDFLAVQMLWRFEYRRKCSSEIRAVSSLVDV